MMRRFCLMSLTAVALSLSACSDGPVDGPDMADKNAAAQEDFFKASEGRWAAKSDNGKSYEVFISGGRIIVSNPEGSSDTGRIIGFYPETMMAGERVDVGFDERSGSLAEVRKLEFISEGEDLAINLDGASMPLVRIMPTAPKDPSPSKKGSNDAGEEQVALDGDPEAV